MPPAARRPRAWSSSVLLPMPGSPASSVTDPATSPPCSTRSSSPTPVGIGAAARASTSPIGTGPSTATRASVPVDASAAASASVPQASHSGQRPSQRGVSHPHSEQRWTVLAVFVFDGIGGPYARGVTLTRTSAPEHLRG